MNQSTYGNAVLRALIKECPNLCYLNISIIHNFELKNCDIVSACEQLKSLRKCYVRLAPRGKKGYNRCIEWKEPLVERYPDIVTIDVRTTYLERLDLSNLATKFALLNRGGEHPPLPPPPPPPPPPALL